MRLILLLLPAIVLTSCDRSSRTGSHAPKPKGKYLEIELTREAGRAAAHGANEQTNAIIEPLRAPMKGVEDFSRGFMEVQVEKMVERSQKNVEESLKKNQFERRQRDKGFPGHNPDAGFPGFDRRK